MDEQNWVETKGDYSPGRVQGNYNVIINQQIVQLEDTQRTLLISILQERADSIFSELDHIIKELDLVNVPDPDHVVKQLKELKERFSSLHEKHLRAVGSGNLLLSHEIIGAIHDVLITIQNLVSSRYGKIGGTWYRSLPRRYAASPELGSDPEYDAVRRSLNYLHEATVSRSTAMTYPGKSPSSIPRELIDLAFKSGA